MLKRICFGCFSTGAESQDPIGASLSRNAKPNCLVLQSITGDSAGNQIQIDKSGFANKIDELHSSFQIRFDHEQGYYTLVDLSSGSGTFIKVD